MAIAVASCQKSETAFPVSEQFTATVESFESQTKTSMTPEKYVVWSQNDRLAIFQGSTLADEYKVADASVGSANGTFSIVTDASDINGDFSAGTELPCNVAFYPFADDLSLTGSVLEDEGPVYEIDGFSLPAGQIYAEGSFANGAFPMLAVTETLSDHNLKFKNVLGALKLQLKGTQTVKSIKITGKNDEILSGTAVVTAYTNNLAPAITMTATDDASKSVTMNCTDGVQLSEGTVTEFIIALPPVVFTEGFIVIITDSKDNEHIVTSDRENEVLRSSLLVMPVVTLGGSVDGEIEGGVVDLSENGTANSYIISAAGSYKFSTVKGNSSESVGAVSSAEVLWETFGTDVTPNVGDLVKNISYKNGEVTFQTADTFTRGNAVIAAKDADGNILWSWHIWLTDQPQGQVYYNNAGTMMDRNLGATSATPGDVGALGLLYQWGRKDPFLGSSSISSDIEAKSTGTWPSAVASSSATGTVDYAILNPTTFVTGSSSSEYDWHYASRDNTLWTTSDKTKSIYDPCPSGWRVPDGGNNGIWSKALGSLSSFEDPLLYDSTNEGMNFSGKFGSASTIWYPASGYRGISFGSLNLVGDDGSYWSASPGSNSAYYLYFYYNGNVSPSYYFYRAIGLSVRCLQE